VTDLILFAVAAGVGLAVLNFGRRPWDRVIRRRSDTLDFTGRTNPRALAEKGDGR